MQLIHLFISSHLFSMPLIFNSTFWLTHNIHLFSWYTHTSIRIHAHTHTPNISILKPHSIPKSKFRKILVEYTTILAHEINKLRLQILEALHIKKQNKKKTTNKPKTNKLESIVSILKIFVFYLNITYFFS